MYSSLSLRMIIQEEKKMDESCRKDFSVSQLPNSRQTLSLSNKVVTQLWQLLPRERERMKRYCSRYFSYFLKIMRTIRNMLDKHEWEGLVYPPTWSCHFLSEEDNVCFGTFIVVGKLKWISVVRTGFNIFS